MTTEHRIARVDYAFKCSCGWSSAVHVTDDFHGSVSNNWPEGARSLHVLDMPVMKVWPVVAR